MLLLVTGSRSWTDRATVREVLESMPDGFELMHGGAPGLDTIAGEEYKALTGNNPIVIRPDYKNHYYKIAPKVRNTTMVLMAVERHKLGEEVVVIGFKDLNSQTGGTNHCIEEAEFWKLKTMKIKKVAS